MQCHYCGSPVEGDEIDYEQKLGLSTDDPDGILSEERFVVGSASCGTCGTHVKSVVANYTNLGDLENEYQSERRPSGLGESIR